MKRATGGSTSGRIPADPSSEASGPAEAAGGIAIGGAELLEDRSIRIGGRESRDAGPGGHQGGRSRRAGLSLGGALAGSLLVAAVALGAASGPLGLIGGGPRHDGARDDTAQFEPTASPAPGAHESGAMTGTTTDGSLDGSAKGDQPGSAAGDGSDGSDVPAATEAPGDGSGSHGS